eukprot:5220331-Pyramimonas_sp.AAC.1
MKYVLHEFTALRAHMAQMAHRSAHGPTEQSAKGEREGAAGHLGDPEQGRVHEHLSDHRAKHLRAPRHPVVRVHDVEQLTSHARLLPRPPSCCVHVLIHRG